MKNYWHKRYLDAAEFFSQWSGDESTKVGAVIVDTKKNVMLSMGYNDLPRGVNDTTARRNRPMKYEFTEHAERNAIYNARGVDLTGSTLYINFYPKACPDCMRGIIQSGITQVIGTDRPFAGVGCGKHYDLADSSFEMAEEAGVEILVYRDDHLWLKEYYDTHYKVIDKFGNTE